MNRDLGTRSLTDNIWKFREYFENIAHRYGFILGYTQPIDHSQFIFEIVSYLATCSLSDIFRRALYNFILGYKSFVTWGASGDSR